MDRMSLLLIMWFAVCVGCSRRTKEWNAEHYFSKPEVIALCDAIRNDNIKSATELLDAGADANAKGRDNMTPLVFSLRYSRTDAFQLLLERGADPNVVFRSGFGTSSEKNDTVVHKTARGKDFGQFESVMKHGGDANLVGTRWSRTPIFEAIDGNNRVVDRIKLLIESGADINFVDELHYTPLIYSC